MAVHKAMFRVDAELYRKYPEIFETVEWRLKQELAEKMFDELEDGKSRIVTLGQTNRMEDEGLYAVRYIKEVQIESIVRCRDCVMARKPNRRIPAENRACEGTLICSCGFEHVYPSDGEELIFVDEYFYCAEGKRKEGEKDEC